MIQYQEEEDDVALDGSFPGGSFPPCYTSKDNDDHNHHHHHQNERTNHRDEPKEKEEQEDLSRILQRRGTILLLI